MNKPFIAFLSFLLFTQICLAQRNGVNDIDRENFFRIGAKGGFNLNKIPGSSYGKGFNYNYQLGGFMQFNFSKRFGIQPEVNFVQATASNTNDITEVTEDLFHGGTQKDERLNYLEIPVLLNINLGESRHVKFQAGPSYGICLKGIPTQGESNIIQNSKNQLGAIGGFWMQLPFINFGGRYHYRFSKTANPATGQTGESQAIEVFTGFTF